MENTYYNLLEIKITSNSKEIIIAYKNKINKFKNLNNFNHNQISEIKTLKKALYILLNKKLRLKYDLNIKLLNNDNNPLPMNFDNDISFDTIFDIDNSWMNNYNYLDNDNKDKQDNTFFNDRIFSLSNLNKKPGFSTNDEINLRNSLQGRVIKDNVKI